MFLVVIEILLFIYDILNYKKEVGILSPKPKTRKKKFEEEEDWDEDVEYDDDDDLDDDWDDYEDLRENFY